MGSKSRKRRTRKHRRQEKAVLKHGTSAKRSHKRPSGRTGKIWQKRTHSKMTTQTKSQIPWGLKNAVPDNAAIAWGARTILRDGYVDLVPDRHGFCPPHGKAVKAFALALENVLPQVYDRVKELCDQNIMMDDFAEQHTLYEDDELCVVGNTNASYGYLYLAAWKK